MAKADAFSDFDALLATQALTDPWAHGEGEPPEYRPDFRLLAELLSIPVRAAQVSESGRFAKAIDAWVAQELRRAGFGADEVWPRASRPRVLPRDIAVLLTKLPTKTADEIARRLPDIAAVGPVDARVLGRAYEKQVDVCIARWERGPELLVSTRPRSRHSPRTCRTASRKPTATPATFAAATRSRRSVSCSCSERRS